MHFSTYGIKIKLSFKHAHTAISEAARMSLICVCMQYTCYTCCTFAAHICNKYQNITS